MRVRAYIRAPRNVGRELHRAEMVEEDEGSNHAPLRERQNAANLEITERSPPGFDNHLQHGHVPPWPEEKERRLPLNTRTALPAPQQHDALLPEPIGKAHRVESVGSAAGVQHQ